MRASTRARLAALCACAALAAGALAAASSPPPGLADVALSKPVLETFSGSGAAATAPAGDSPATGWFSTAFPAFNDKALYPETLLLDLLAVYNISGLAFDAPPPPAPFAPPGNFTLWTALPGAGAWTRVPLQPPSLAFPAAAARYVRLVVASVAAPGPNFTLAVGRLRVWGQPAPLPPPAVAWPPPPRPQQPPRPARLLAERRQEPIDVDTPTPLLSWALESSRAGERVTAWQVALRRGGEALWDTGRVNGSAFSVAAAPAAPLRAGDAVAWGVRLWDADGAPTPWANATFALAKLGPGDWAGQWVGGDSALVLPGAYGPGHPAVYLRGAAYLPAPPVRAVASFAGLGWGRLLVNGARAAPLELSPGFTTYELRTQYNVFDVTALLAGARPGVPVVFAAVLGDGWYALARDSSCCANFQHQPYVNSTRMLLDVDLWFADGSSARLGSNASWEWALGEVTSTHFNGESVDKGRALPADWAASTARGAAGGPPPWGAWRPVALLDGPPAVFPGSVLTAQKEPPTTAAAEALAPQAQRSAPEPNGTGTVLIYDFGAELQGRVRVTASAPAPARLRILVCGSFYLTRAFTCDEATAPSLNNGEGPGLYNFTLAGTGAPETYEPLFSYAAIRRVVVHVPAGGAAVLSVGSVRVAMEQPRGGAFATSSDTYNWLHEALVRTQTNYITGFPNDPSRERVGYTQDMENMFRGAAYDLASSERMYARWAQDMADGQAYALAHPGTGIPAGAGQMPTVIPGPKSDGANSVWWGGMLVWLPWRHFLHFGDERLLARLFDGMAAYVAYLNSSAPGHLVEWGLADWNSPLPQCSAWGFRNATSAINTPGLYRMARTLGDVAAHLGRAEQAAALAALADATAAAFNAAFLDAATGRYSTGQQCHQAMALAMEGLVPQAQRGAAVAALRARALADNTTLTVGFVSFLHLVLVLADEDPALLHALVTRRNYGDAAFTAACVDKDGPGGRPSTWPGCAPGPYANSVGAFPSSDLMKESWQGADAVMPSLSGPLLVHSWHTLAGIRAPEDLAGAGFRNFSLLPSPVPGLLWLRAHHDAPLGRIEAAWVVAGGAFYFEAVVPPGAAASVGLPCQAAGGGLFEGGAPRSEGVQWRAGRAYVSVGAGQWAWNCTLAEGFARSGEAPAG